jgi:hypothetical protein
LLVFPFLRKPLGQTTTTTQTTRQNANKKNKREKKKETQGLVGFVLNVRQGWSLYILDKLYDILRGHFLSKLLSHYFGSDLFKKKKNIASSLKV